MRARSSDRSLEILTSSSGDLLVSDTNPHVGKYAAIKVCGTVTFGSVSQEDNTAAVTVKSDLTSKTVIGPVTIYPGIGDGNEYFFSSVQLSSVSSGNIILVYF